MTAIDVHAHVIVPELLRSSALGESWRPRVVRHDGAQLVEFGGARIRSMVSEVVDVEEIVASQDRAGVGITLLCPWVQLLFYDVDVDAALERCQLQNSGLARLHAGCPDRVRVLGAVPLQDPELAASELERVMATAGFAGVEVATSVDGVPLGDARFEPFWSAAERTGALVFIHPTTRGVALPVLQERYLWNLVGNPMETTVAAAHLVLTGTLARHPNLRILLAHGGGAILALSGRLRHGQATVAAAGPAPAVAADAEIRRRFLYDSVVHDPQLLRMLVQVVGSERVLLGSDYPFDMADSDPVGTVRAAGLSEGDEHALLCGNATRELGLSTTNGRG
jgi:aminocarboxymuconate-semialdehyde decarboxylase